MTTEFQVVTTGKSCNGVISSVKALSTLIQIAMIPVAFVVLTACGEDELDVDGERLSGIVQDQSWEFFHGNALPAHNNGAEVDVVLSDRRMRECTDIEDRRSFTVITFRIPPEVGTHEDVMVEFLYNDEGRYEFGFSGTKDTVEITDIRDSVIYGELEVRTEGTERENDVSGAFAARICDE